MDERFGPRDLVDDATLRSLSERSDRFGLLHLAGHLALLVATGSGVWLARGTPWLLLAVPAHGAALIFLFAPLHETIHRTAFRSRWLNDAVAWFAGLVLMLPPSWFRQFHFAHHRWTQDAARDPELNPPRPATFPAWLWHVSGLPYWIAAVRGLLQRALGRIDDAFVGARDRASTVAEARLFLATYTAILAVASMLDGWHLLFWLWLIPVLAGQPLLRLYLLAEHWGCAMGPDMLRNTRTTLTWAPMRFLAWNMPFHAEHHAFPGVPFHALPRLHSCLAPHLHVLGPGYVHTTIEILQGIGRRRSQPVHTGNP
jgi:fatty acid desaturase